MCAHHLPDFNLSVGAHEQGKERKVFMGTGYGVHVCCICASMDMYGVAVPTRMG